MNVFSYHFFVLWLVSLILYYTIAGSRQWMLLLLMSLIFYVYSITKVPVVLISISLLTYIGAVAIVRERKKTETAEAGLKWFRRFISGACIVILMTGSVTNWFALLGNSYFTLKAISYLNDAEREGKCEKNYWFYLLYLIYLPTVLQGPFNRYAQFKESLAEKISFDYTEFMHGL